MFEQSEMFLMSKGKDSRNRGFEEKAHLNVDAKTYENNHKEIFGEQKKFCDNCEKRLSLCECSKDPQEDADEALKRSFQLEIKNKALESFRHLDSYTSTGVEGFNSWSYIQGYMNGYNQSLKDNK
jgi:hypothetical protein